MTCLMYEDDLLQLSASICGLQRLLDMLWVVKSYVDSLMIRSPSVLYLDQDIAVNLHLCYCYTNRYNGLIL